MRATPVASGGSWDAVRRLPVARSEQCATAWSLATGRGERWGTTVSRRLAAPRRERWATTVSTRLAAPRRERRAARFVPRGCRVDDGGGDTAGDG
jgi:hypothetical protein